jgi:metal-responsive CopG/Arc/MetJ family transcriptional regulator
MKKMVSLRVTASVFNLFDRVRTYNKWDNRSRLIEELMVTYIKENAPSELLEEFNNSVRYEMEKEELEKRVKTVLSELKKYHSQKKVQRYIDSEKYAVGLRVYKEYKNFYETFETPLNPPVDIKSI